ncbi:hypothetical protein P5673_021194 [Acropora cervicornis]|uniref:Uncharacterized protein n=1 Tax=Acropora cervicornis TaxID=6130 RepID=A0AAD9Q984_ACRCE|nr:hypothetical protein P5673_021194 [Acropora cervicornis]
MATIARGQKKNTEQMQQILSGVERREEIQQGGHWEYTVNEGSDGARMCKARNVLEKFSHEGPGRLEKVKDFKDEL